MSKYRIDFVQTVTEGVTLYVEADDEEAAEKKAGELLDSGRDENGEPVIWKFVDVEQPWEIIGCEEWPPVNDPDPSEHTVIDLIEALKRTEQTT